MPTFINPLKRSAESEDALLSSRKRPSLAPGQEQYWMVTWYDLLNDSFRVGEELTTQENACAGEILKPRNIRPGKVMQYLSELEQKLHYTTQMANSAYICIFSSLFLARRSTFSL